ncbi:general substrate transporter [Syncephalastrum racemosum]|uniref:General substrate transporter n=1 Tax=Syncephalastrum racemosum TaxID=13706 RepID=A0A1X2HRK0_SYNRA|nr:general substrate transporter [Syncephalastrum racemosum]
MPGFIPIIGIKDTVDTQVTLTTLLSVGAFVASLLSGLCADWIGRRGLLFIGCIIYFPGTLLQMAAEGAAMLYVGRILAGFSVGQIHRALTFFDQSELAPTKLRGRLISFQQFAIVVGIVSASWISFGCLRIRTPSSWRLAIGIQFVVGGIYALGLGCIPRSPRYLIQKGREEEALHALAQIRGDGTLTHPEVRCEFTEIKQSILFAEKFLRPRYSQVFRKDYHGTRRRILLGIAVQAFQQLTGANSLLIYNPAILEGEGIDGRVTQILAHGIGSTVLLVGTLPAMIFIDRWGRRPIMIGGSIVMTICQIVMTIIAVMSGFHLEPPVLSNGTDNDVFDSAAYALNSVASSIIFVIFVYIFMFVYGSTWGPMGWIYPPELYSQAWRSKGLGLSSAANWLFTFGVLQLTPLALERIHWSTYVVYLVFNVFVLVVVYFCFPETLGKSLEEVDLLFAGPDLSSDPAVHHPKTAAEALSKLETMEEHYNYDFAHTTRVEESLQPPRSSI